VADSVWRATVREEPPTTKSKSTTTSRRAGWRGDAATPGRRVPDAVAEQIHVNPWVDLSLDAGLRFCRAWRLGVDTADRTLPAPDELAFDAMGWLDLPPATYGMRYAEWVEMPADCGGFVFRGRVSAHGRVVPTASGTRAMLAVRLACWWSAIPHGVASNTERASRQLVLFRTDRSTHAAYPASISTKAAEQDEQRVSASYADESTPAARQHDTSHTVVSVRF